MEPTAEVEEISPANLAEVPKPLEHHVLSEENGDDRKEIVERAQRIFAGKTARRVYMLTGPDGLTKLGTTHVFHCDKITLAEDGEVTVNLTVPENTGGHAFGGSASESEVRLVGGRFPNFSIVYKWAKVPTPDGSMPSHEYIEIYDEPRAFNALNNSES